MAVLFTKAEDLFYTLSWPDHSDMQKVCVDSISAGDIIVISGSKQINFVVESIQYDAKSKLYTIWYYDIKEPDFKSSANEAAHRKYNVRRLKREKKAVSNFPHVCPKCSGAAYVGLNVIECSANKCFS